MARWLCPSWRTSTLLGSCLGLSWLLVPHSFHVVTTYVAAFVLVIPGILYGWRRINLSRRRRRIDLSRRGRLLFLYYSSEGAPFSYSTHPEGSIGGIPHCTTMSSLGTTDCLRSTSGGGAGVDRMGDGVLLLATP